MTNRKLVKKIAKWIGAGAVLALAGLLGFGCSSIPLIGGGASAQPGKSNAPAQDAVAAVAQAAPAFLDSVGNLLWTIFLTGVILSFMSTKVRAAFAEAGVAFWLRIKYRIESYRRPKEG